MMRLFPASLLLSLAAILGGCLSDSPQNAGPDSVGEEPLAGDTLTSVDTSLGGGRPVTAAAWRKPYWPLAVGNTWTYLHRTIRKGPTGNIVHNDTTFDTVTVSIIASRTDSTGAVWWRFHATGPLAFPNGMLSLSRSFELLSRNDTLFMATLYPDTGAVTHRYVQPSLIYLDSTLKEKFYSFNEYDQPMSVMADTGSYTTPAGTAHGTVRYWGYVAESVESGGHASIVYKPGIGMIGYDYGISAFWEPGYGESHHVRLISYTLAP